MQGSNYAGRVGITGERRACQAQDKVVAGKRQLRQRRVAEEGSAWSLADLIYIIVNLQYIVHNRNAIMSLMRCMR